MMTILTFQTARFGKLDFEENDVVTMPDGMVGLPLLKRFLVLQHKEGSPFRWLQSLDEPSAAFLVVDPTTYVPDYSPDMPLGASAALDLSDDTPILVYTVCTVPNGNPRGLTLNLAGPIVVNGNTRRARQIVLDDEAYPVKYPAFSRVQETEAA
jgi:flagellar assembly factor FliW